jgi:hypothetical protein
MIGTQGPWEGSDLYRATPAATQGFGFSSNPKDHFTKSPLTKCKGMTRAYSNPNPQGAILINNGRHLNNISTIIDLSIIYYLRSTQKY